jgi:hypothetical protein
MAQNGAAEMKHGPRRMGLQAVLVASSFKPLQQRGKQFVWVDRFGDEIIHAGILAAHLVIEEGIRGHRDDGG